MMVLTTDWTSSKAQLQFVRKQVFILEQGISEAEEWDDLDESAVHFVAFGTTAVPAGVCRLTEQGQFGRLAVLPSFRGQGYASQLIRKALQVARELSLEKVVLNAQLDAQLFYEKHGFHPIGKPFLEADILHIRMEKHFK